jgi:hypothetical protein
MRNNREDLTTTNLALSVIGSWRKEAALTGELAVILHPMADSGFWKKIWEEDLRAPSRDLVNQVFYVVVTVFFDAFSKLILDHSTVAEWLRGIIYNVFDALTLIALAQLAFPMAIRMIRSAIRSARKP